jgi:hypothetical protein
LSLKWIVVISVVSDMKLVIPDVVIPLDVISNVAVPVSVDQTIRRSPN